MDNVRCPMVARLKKSRYEPRELAYAKSKNGLETRSLQRVPRCPPSVPIQIERTARLAQRGSQIRSFDQLHDCIRKRCRIVREQEVVSTLTIQPLCSHGCRDHSPRRCPSLQNLKARPAAGKQRNDADLGFG